MTNKKITPVTFSDESVEIGEQVFVRPIARVAPGDSGSIDLGSGSGMINETGGGVIHIPVGGNWSVNADFKLDIVTDYGYSVITGKPYVKSARIKVAGDVSLFCNPISTGVRKDGIAYDPFSSVMSFAVDEDEHNQSLLDGEMFFMATFNSKTQQEFKTQVTEYDSEGHVISSTTDTQYRTIVMTMDFGTSFPVDKPEVSLRSCVISVE